MKLGFIGAGNMAIAMLKGIIDKKIVPAPQIIVSDAVEQALSKAKELGVQTTTSNLEVVKQANIVVLAVKPQYVSDVIDEIRYEVGEDTLFISIVAGKTIAWFEDKFQIEVKLIRTMPNTPALVGEGMTGVTPNALVTKEELNEAIRILESFGKVELVSEQLMNVVASVSGSSPAYVFMMLEAMADGAVADGMPRDQAYRFAAQAVLGSAKLMLDTGMHPGALKDMVCSPGGTTIEAVRVLEEKGMRSGIMEAMRACVKKAEQL